VLYHMRSVGGAQNCSSPCHRALSPYVRMTSATPDWRNKYHSFCLPTLELPGLVDLCGCMVTVTYRESLLVLRRSPIQALTGPTVE